LGSVDKSNVGFLDSQAKRYLFNELARVLEISPGVLEFATLRSGFLVRLSEEAAENRMPSSKPTLRWAKPTGPKGA
jgi:hypothetical protein